MKTVLYKVDNPGKISLDIDARSENAALLIVTPSKYRTICNGIDFQEFVWGNERASLWIVHGNKVKCFVGRYVLLPFLNNTFYVSSKNEYTLPETLLEMIDYIKETIEKLARSTRFRKFFVLISDKNTIQDNIIYIKTSEGASRV